MCRITKLVHVSNLAQPHSMVLPRTRLNLTGGVSASLTSHKFVLQHLVTEETLAEAFVFDSYWASIVSPDPQRKMGSTTMHMAEGSHLLRPIKTITGNCNPKDLDMALPLRPELCEVWLPGHAATEEVEAVLFPSSWMDKLVFWKSVRQKVTYTRHIL